MTKDREKLTEPLLVALKRVSAVEAERQRSNQHEFNGTEPLRLVLGDDPHHDWKSKWVFLDDGHEPRLEVHLCSWYDARADHPTRSEWRLYYQGSPELAEGDLLVVFNRRNARELLLVIARSGSTPWGQFQGLLDATEGEESGFRAITLEALEPAYADVLTEVLEFAGWMAYPLAGATEDLHGIFERFPDGFPSSREFSQYARACTADADRLEPDDLLWAWYRKEEALFRALEHHELQAKLVSEPAFDGVEDFLEFSLSIQNRRKSRAGLALENHFEELLRWQGLVFSRGKVTEGARRPDFILPGAGAYHDPTFPESSLTMVGVKTTCKDRWRQILNEAARIPQKHLLTLEPGISRTQLEEMAAAQVIIVAPKLVLATYNPPSELLTMSIADALMEFKERQRQTQSSEDS